jgi:hypothetical protein
MTINVCPSAVEAGRQKLEGNEAVELEIAGLVDHAHTALAELLDNLVMGNGLSDHRCRLR